MALETASEKTIDMRYSFNFKRRVKLICIGLVFTKTINLRIFFRSGVEPESFHKNRQKYSFSNDMNGGDVVLAKI